MRFICRKATQWPVFRCSHLALGQGAGGPLRSTCLLANYHHALTIYTSVQHQRDIHTSVWLPFTTYPSMHSSLYSHHLHDSHTFTCLPFIIYNTPIHSNICHLTSTRHPYIHMSTIQHLQDIHTFMCLPFNIHKTSIHSCVYHLTSTRHPYIHMSTI